MTKREFLIQYVLAYGAAEEPVAEDVWERIVKNSPEPGLCRAHGHRSNCPVDNQCPFDK